MSDEQTSQQKIVVKESKWRKNICGIINCENTPGYGCWLQLCDVHFAVHVQGMESLVWKDDLELGYSEVESSLTGKLFVRRAV